MAHQEIVESRVIDAPHDAVWNVLTDIRNVAVVLRGIEKIEVVDGGDYEVGLRWRETRKMFGVTATEEMWVSDLDPGVFVRIDSESKGLRSTTRFELQEIGHKTRLITRFAPGALNDVGLVRRAAGTLFGRAGEALTREAMRRDLADIELAAAGKVNEMTVSDDPQLAGAPANA